MVVIAHWYCICPFPPIQNRKNLKQLVYFEAADPRFLRQHKRHIYGHRSERRESEHYASKQFLLIEFINRKDFGSKNHFHPARRRNIGYNHLIAFSSPEYSPEYLTLIATCIRRLLDFIILFLSLTWIISPDYLIRRCPTNSQLHILPFASPDAAILGCRTIGF